VDRRIPSRLASRIDSRILIAFVFVALVALGFAVLASEVAEGDTLAFDSHILHALRDPRGGVPIGPKWLTAAMLDFTALGGASVLTLLTILASGYLAAARKAATAAYLIIAVAGGSMLGTLLKHLFARPRPDEVTHLVLVSSASFPSGHALNSSVAYLTLGVLLAKTQTSRHLRIYIVSTGMAVSILVGFSRVFLGVHWPSDVLAGWAVGGAWALLCSAIFDYLQRSRRIQANSRGAPPPSSLGERK
jgi:undecaprenyl-diphosphatase